MTECLTKNYGRNYNDNFLVNEDTEASQPRAENVQPKIAQPQQLVQIILPVPSIAVTPPQSRSSDKVDLTEQWKLFKTTMYTNDAVLPQLEKQPKEYRFCHIYVQVYDKLSAV